MAEQTTPATTAESICAVFSRQASAWNAGDAKQYAATFATDTTATNIFGDSYLGREALHARMAEILGGVFKGSTLRLDVRRMALPRPDVAIVDLDARVHGGQGLPSEMLAADGSLRTAMLQVLVRENDGWRVAAFHNVLVRKS
jgi:uncharacterized protein (TIGR02246 family)